MARRVTFRSNQGFSLGPIGFLIVTNLILYIATSVSSRLGDLLAFHPDIFLERPWTIVTSMFVHAPFPSIWHILANMITLYFFGSYLLRLVGERNFFILYFLGGIIGNVFYAFILTPPFLTVGASGAIFAVGGALAVMSPRLRVFIIPIPVPLPLWVAVIGGCLIISFFPHVAWQAHLGGLVFGLVTAYFFWRRQRRFY